MIVGECKRNANYIGGVIPARWESGRRCRRWQMVPKTAKSTPQPNYNIATTQLHPNYHTIR